MLNALRSLAVFAALTAAACGPGSSEPGPSEADDGGASGASAGAGRGGGSAAGGGGSASTAGGGSAGAAGGGNATGGNAGDAAGGSGADAASWLGALDTICEEQCQDGCIPPGPQVNGCKLECFSQLRQSLTRCPAEAQPYLRCVADGGPLYYCPGYGEGSPCSAELSTLAACVNEDGK